MRLPLSRLRTRLAFEIQRGARAVWGFAVVGAFGLLLAKGWFQDLGSTEGDAVRAASAAALIAVLAAKIAGRLRTNERLTTVLGQIRQRETREAAYAWVERNFDALVGVLGREIGAQLTAISGAFCGRAEAERARAFLAPRVDALTGGPRLLQLHVETSELCSAFADAHRDAARRYFAADSD